ncbi:ABC transporter permease [Spiroplasma endosymbiont of Crioceris asparagi]|uniref:ABC transporter permease n=1 Tax=Spiroplasma endosymbiont of Crioceris asparagi TaxID=3066286 RepID=UPI0030CB03B7
MFLIFKNNLKQLIKQYIQFIVYIFLLLLISVFTTILIVTSSYLIQQKNQLNESKFNFEYSYKMTTTSYTSNDTQNISPWYAFNTKLTDSKNISNKETLTISNGLEDAKSNNNAIYFDTKNFKWLKDENTNEEYFDSSIYNVGGYLNKDYFLNTGFGDSDPIVYIDYQHRSEEGDSYFDENSGHKLYARLKSNNQKLQDSDFIINWSNETKFSYVKNGNFGLIYNFNFDSKYFQKSLIGFLYNKFDLRNIKDYQSASMLQKNVIDHIFNYMFYLNNSSITTLIKNRFIDSIDWNKPEINDFFNDNNNVFGKIVSSNNEDTYVLGSKENGDFASLRNGEESKKFNDIYNSLEKNGVYLVRDFDASYNFMTKASVDASWSFGKKFITNGDFFESYYNLVGDLSNFNLRDIQQTVMWNSLGEKFRYISAYSGNGEEQAIKFNENVGLHIYKSKKPEGLVQYGVNTFVSSATYPDISNDHKKPWTFGNEYNIFPDIDYKVTFDATGVDSFNSYPTIYDDDIIPDQNRQAIFYLNNVDFKNAFSNSINPIYKDNTSGKAKLVDNEKFQDVSRMFMQHIGNKKSQINDINIYKLYLADNFISLDKINSIINNEKFDIKNIDGNLLKDSIKNNVSIEDKKTTKTISARQNLFGSSISAYLLISIVTVLIMTFVILFVMLNIVKKILEGQKRQIGCLKSLGISNKVLYANFLLFMTVPSLLIVPIGWLGGVFLQTTILNTFGTYFNIQVETIFNIKVLLSEMLFYFVIIILISFLVSRQIISLPALKLFETSVGKNTSSISSKLNSLLRTKKPLSKLRNSLFTSSLKEISILFTILFVASSIFTISFIIPTTVNNVKKEYYENIKFKNDYNYKNVYENVPLSRVGYFDYKNKDDVQENSTFGYKLFKDNKDIFNTTDKTDLLNKFNELFFNNLTTFKGVNLSVGLMDDLAKVDGKSASDNNSIAYQLDNFATTMLPKLLGQDSISIKSIPKPFKNKYEYAIALISGNLINSTIKEKWEQDNYGDSFKNFLFSFSNVPVNQNEKDTIYTTSSGMASSGKKTLDTQIFGLPKNGATNGINLKHFASLSSTGDEIPVLASENFRAKGFKKGDKITIKVPNNLVKFNSDKSSLETTILNNDSRSWQYITSGKEEQDKNYLFSNKFNPSKTTYLERGINKIDNEDSEYTKMQDVYLTVPKKLLEADKTFANNFYKTGVEYLEYLGVIKKDDIKDSKNVDYKTLFDDNKKAENVFIGTDDNSDSYKIRAYDIRKYDNTAKNFAKLSSLSLASGTNSWWNIALQNNLIVTDTSVKESPQKLKIIDFEKIYDKSRLIMKQEDANKVLGYSNPDETYANGINIWSNAKLSNETEIVDQITRQLFTTTLGNNATENINANLKPLINKTNYIEIEKQAFINLVQSAYSIGIIFIFGAIILSLITIYNVAKLFIDKFRTFIGFMQVLGYTKREVSYVVLGILAPTAIVATITPMIILILLITDALPAVLLKVGFLVPLTISWWIIPAILLISFAIFLITFIMVFRSLKKVPLQEIMGN